MSEEDVFAVLDEDVQEYTAADLLFPDKEEFPMTGFGREKDKLEDEEDNYRNVLEAFGLKVVHEANDTYVVEDTDGNRYSVVRKDSGIEFFRDPDNRINSRPGPY